MTNDQYNFPSPLLQKKANQITQIIVRLHSKAHGPGRTALSAEFHHSPHRRDVLWLQLQFIHHLTTLLDEPWECGEVSSPKLKFVWARVIWPRILGAAC